MKYLIALGLSIVACGATAGDSCFVSSNAVQVQSFSAFAVPTTFVQVAAPVQVATVSTFAVAAPVFVQNHHCGVNVQVNNVKAFNVRAFSRGRSVSRSRAVSVQRFR